MGFIKKIYFATAGFIKYAYLATRPLPQIVAIIWLGTWFYLSFTAPQDIYYNYEGIIHQRGHPEVAVPINVEIDGEYKRSIWGDADAFAGTVKLGDKVFSFSDWPMKFNKDKMAGFDNATEQWNSVNG